MANIKKISVNATIELDMDRITALKLKLENEPHGTQSRERVWNDLQAIQVTAFTRLKGELAAYENIAKHQISEVFKISS